MLAALSRVAAQLVHTAGEPVAQPLELLEAEQARTAPEVLRGAARRGDMRERLGDDRRQLALEPCHL